MDKRSDGTDSAPDIWSNATSHPCPDPVARIFDTGYVCITSEKSTTAMRSLRSTSCPALTSFNSPMTWQAVATTFVLVTKTVPSKCQLPSVGFDQRIRPTDFAAVGKVFRLCRALWDSSEVRGDED